MLSNEEFLRQRAAKLNNNKEKEKTNSFDYTENKSFYNRRSNNMVGIMLNDMLNAAKPLLVISLPVCFIIALFASFCLLLTGIITNRTVLMFVIIIFFILLYIGLILALVSIGAIKKTKAQLYNEIKQEILKEYNIVEIDNNQFIRKE